MKDIQNHKIADESYKVPLIWALNKAHNGLYTQ